MVRIKTKGNFNKTHSFLDRMRSRDYLNVLNKYGQMGVDALSAATPIDTGLTASSWGYEIHSSGATSKIVWTNSNVNDGVPIAILIQYGHGTRGGTYVQGIDFINPAMRSVFDNIADAVWKEVTR